MLADTNDSALVVDDPARLDGLAPDAIAAAARAAEVRGHPGRYVLPLVLPTHQPALPSLSDRALREQLFRASVSRGARGDGNDTRDLVRRITALRAERAGLLGHPHHASWVVEVGTAETVEAVEKMLAALVAARGPQRRGRDGRAGRRRRVTRSSRGTAPSTPERSATGGPPTPRALRPYLELERVLHHGVFAAAGELYGLQFTERHDLPVYHPDVRVFHVKHDGRRPVGLFVADHYARETKRGGAWMNSFVGAVAAARHAAGGAQHPEPRQARRRRPALLTVDEVVTLFHEFGHALHGLLSDVRYPMFAGTGVPRDFVEFPSQVNEIWLRDPAVSTATPGTTSPASRCRRTAGPADRPGAEFGEGFAPRSTWRRRCSTWPGTRLAPGEEVDDVEAFEAAALAAAGRPAEAPPRYRSAYFSHVFAGAYSAAYYSYIWSEVLDADTVDWFARARRPAATERRRLRAGAALARRRRRPAGGVPRLPRARPGDRPAAGAPRPGERVGQ